MRKTPDKFIGGRESEKYFFELSKIIKTTAFFVALAFSSNNANANDNPLWNGTAVKIERPDGGYGQGYVVLDEKTDEIKVYTIKHVIDDVKTHVYITIPNFTDSSEVDVDRFECEYSSWGPKDDDTGCYVTLNNVRAQKIKDEDTVKSVVRKKAPEGLKVGNFVCSPRPDTGRWSAYEIVEIQDDLIVISVSGMDFDDDSLPDEAFGEFCHGRSGGPALLCELKDPELPGQKALFNVYTDKNGFPISVGEIEGGLDNSSHEDREGKMGKGCYDVIVVNRVM